MLKPGFDHITNICSEGQKRGAVPLADTHFDGNERRIDDPDADLFHRRDEVGLAILILAQNR